MPFETEDVSKEYLKNKNLKKEDVEALQQWLEKQPHLPKISEFQLILFLHSCYYSLEATKSAIDAFFTFKTHFPDVLGNRDPYGSRCKEAMDYGMVATLPKCTPEGYRVFIYTFRNGDLSKFIATEQMKLFDMTIRLSLQEEGTAEGVIFLINSKELTFGHVARIGISSARNFLTYLQDALPVRLKGLHLINAGGAAEKLLTICRPFIKPELNKVLHLYSDVSEGVFKIVPQDCLPKDFGGSADSIEGLHDLMKVKLLDNAAYFVEDEKAKSDESKRVEKIYNFETPEYGLDGSFKKLELD